MLIPVARYLHHPWNATDIVHIMMVAVAIVLRLLCVERIAVFFATIQLRENGCRDADSCSGCYQLQVWARVLYSVVTLIVWLRMFDVFRAFEANGKLKILFFKLMSKDVVTFLKLITVVSPGFGIAFAALQPTHFPRPFKWWTMLYEMDSPLMSPFWGILGEYQLDEMLEATEGTPPTHVLLPLLLYAYLLITTVVLVNLLIAAMVRVSGSLPSIDHLPTSRAVCVLAGRDLQWLHGSFS